MRGISDAFCDADLLAEAIHGGLSGQQPIDEALARYEQRRNARAIPENEANLAAAHLEGWDTPEVMGLRQALRDNPSEAGRFYAARLQVIPPQEFFAPEHIGRIMAQAQQRNSARATHAAATNPDRRL